MRYRQMTQSGSGTHGHAPAVDLSVWPGHLPKRVLRTCTTAQTHGHLCSSQATLPPASGPLHFWQLLARLVPLAFRTPVKDAFLEGELHGYHVCCLECSLWACPCLRLFAGLLGVHLSPLDNSIACLLCFRPSYVLQTVLNLTWRLFPSLMAMTGNLPSAYAFVQKESGHFFPPSHHQKAVCSEYQWTPMARLGSGVSDLCSSPLGVTDE